MFRARELWFALLAMLLIAAVYAAVSARLAAVPAAGDLFGHGLGIVGFLLMLSTETLYSLRKRSRRARWGRMSSWLRFHIFTGLVGPFMVLLHTSWKFNGLAGAVTAMMIVVVLSGIVGRYIYTAVPRTVEGLEVSEADLQAQIAAAEAELQRWLAEQPEAARSQVMNWLRLADAQHGGGASLILGRRLAEWRWWLEAKRQRRMWEAVAEAPAYELERLLRERQTLRRQAASLAAARRMLATWHSVHIPIGLALFTAAFVHIGGAIYYATLLR